MVRRRRWIVTLLIALSLALVAGMVWAGGFLYWHFRLAADLRRMEAEMQESRDGNSDHYECPLPVFSSFYAAGCRSYPYMADALEPGRKRCFLQFCSRRLMLAFDERHVPEADLFNYRWDIAKADSPEVAAPKCRQIRDWWRDHGAKYHQAWHWWTDKCRSE